MPNISAYIPCFNNAATLADSIASVLDQTVPVTEVIVVDDGSSDDTASVAQNSGARVVRFPSNRGRGAARKVGMEECHSDLVLCVDGNKALPRDFLARALPWFENPQVAAVCGSLCLPEPKTVVERWSARHVYRTEHDGSVQHYSSLITAGALCRKAAFIKAGNYDEHLAYAEDREISHRLIKLNADIVFDPKLEVQVLGKHDLATALDRFWRWNVGQANMSIEDYLKYVAYSIKVMAAKDMSQGDIASAALSLLSAHHLFWRTRVNR